ncbi:MAG: TIGR04076 family protein [Thermoplasmatota archaeon]
MLEITVIEGSCSVYEKGDKIIIDGKKIDLEKSDALCTHALSTILHFTTSLEKGISPVELGLSKEEGVAYMQCVDVGKPYTDAQTIVFKCEIK